MFMGTCRYLKSPMVSQYLTSMTPEAKIIETLFKVADKKRNDVDFILNPAQRDLDATFTGRDLIPKARQKGISTYYLGRFTAACLMYRNTRAVVISHDSLSTEKMLDRVHYFIENIRGPKPVIGKSSTNEITFPKTNSVFYIGTAGARVFGRGDTISHLHCSEIAYWPNPLETMTGLLQAVPFDTGEVGIESTGKGVGNYYHNLCMRAKDGKGRYKLHFYSWLFDDEYSLPLSPAEQEDIMNNLLEELDEPNEVARNNLTAGQIAFRRMRLEELDYDIQKFKQEYPSTLDECFQASSDSIFKVVNHQPKEEWVSPCHGDSHMAGLEEHPVQGQKYIVGGDVGAGVEKDNSVMEVFTFPQLEQVAEYASNTIQPDDFGLLLARFGKFFNDAFVTVENNNFGILTLKTLLDNYDSTMIFRTEHGATKIIDYGFRTTASTRPMILGELVKLIKKEMEIHSDYLKGELSTFIQNSSGKSEADINCLDDRVMATAMIAAGITEAGLRFGIYNTEKLVYDPEKDPFSVISLINELKKGKSGNLPISLQTVDTSFDGEIRGFPVH